MSVNKRKGATKVQIIELSTHQSEFDATLWKNNSSTSHGLLGEAKPLSSSEARIIGVIRLTNNI